MQCDICMTCFRLSRLREIMKMQSRHDVIMISKFKTSPDGGSILDGGRTVVADKAGSHADFETGPLPLDKADTVNLFRFSFKSVPSV
jgi:hypothetical protein